MGRGGLQPISKSYVLSDHENSYTSSSSNAVDAISLPPSMTISQTSFVKKSFRYVFINYIGRPYERCKWNVYTVSYYCFYRLGEGEAYVLDKTDWLPLFSCSKWYIKSMYLPRYVRELSKPRPTHLTTSSWYLLRTVHMIITYISHCLSQLLISRT